MSEISWKIYAVFQPFYFSTLKCNGRQRKQPNELKTEHDRLCLSWVIVVHSKCSGEGGMSSVTLRFFHQLDFLRMNLLASLHFCRSYLRATKSSVLLIMIKELNIWFGNLDAQRFRKSIRVFCSSNSVEGQLEERK